MLSKLGSEDLKRYKLNFCDLLDLFDLVEKYVSKKKATNVESTIVINSLQVS